ncbi:outer membrane protein TOM13-domain-containing protein [Dichotomocladium elegans]|nr:outer membrane protein TOM13-domain-containing protein [Dichotomocladium elegans]
MAEIFEKPNMALARRDPWYRNPTFLWVLKSTAVNLILPFFNGVMLGFGEILANELVFKFGWFGFSRVSPSTALGLSPGIPPSGTHEYRKTLQTESKRAEMAAATGRYSEVAKLE